MLKIPSLLELRFSIIVYRILFIIFTCFFSIASPAKTDDSDVDIGDILRKITKLKHSEITEYKNKKDYCKTSGFLTYNKTEPLKIEYTYYKTNLGRYRKNPLLFLFSGLSGVSFIERYLARSFARRGYNVLLSHFFEKDKAYDIYKVSENAFRTLQANFALVDHFSTKDETDPEKLVMFGISYGGIRTVYHVGLDKRIKAASVVVAGAPLPEVMAYSDLKEVRKIRKAQMKQAQLESIEDYLKRVKGEMQIDITQILKSRSREDFQLFIAKKDHWVPTQQQENLWIMLDKPERYSFKLGHIGTPLAVALRYIPTIDRFFKKHWNDHTEDESSGSDCDGSDKET